MSPNIIFEDEYLLVIDKPAGVVVNRADTTVGIETIQDWVDNKFSIFKFQFSNPLEEEFKSRSGIVHRLDKDTSGLLIIAKKPQSFEFLKNQFKQRTTVKKYIALVHGRVEPPMSRINAPIARNPFNRMHFGVFPGGREAITDYKSLKYLKWLKGLREVETLTLLEVTPHTGRTHQIRAHMKYINHAVVCDQIYGGRKMSRMDAKHFPRLFLHAAHLEIKHPKTGEIMKFDSKLPKDLEDSLRILDKPTESVDKPE